MKKNIILLLVFLISLFIAYRIGFHRGYNYTVPAMKLAFNQGKIKGITKDDIDKCSNWLNNAQARDFGNYYLFKPDNDKINALWVCRKEKPYSPCVTFEEKDDSSLTNITINDQHFNSINIDYDRKKQKISNIAYFFTGGSIFDLNGNGAWDLRSIKQKDGYLHEIQIDSTWYKITSKKNKIEGEKDHIYIHTENGIKEVYRDGGDYHIKSD